MPTNPLKKSIALSPSSKASLIALACIFSSILFFRLASAEGEAPFRGSETAETGHGCFLYKNYAVLVTPHQGGVGEDIQAWPRKKDEIASCDAKKMPFLNQRGNNDDFFKGVYDHFLFVDSGTSASERGLRIYDLPTQKVVLDTVWVGPEPKREGQTFLFYEDAGLCKGETRKDFPKFLNQCVKKYHLHPKSTVCQDSITNALDRETLFNLTSLRKRTTGVYRCGYRE